jgi:hypothetical protein
LNTVLSRGKEHLSSVFIGNEDALEALFFERLKAWEQPFISDECGTYGLFTDIQQNISSHIAFSLIQKSVEIALSQSDPKRLNCAFYLIYGLIESTKTTEIPASITKYFPALKILAQQLEISPQALSAIQGYYHHAF